MSFANPTLDDVWKLFQETDRRFQETDRKFQVMREENDKNFDKLTKEVDRVNKEVDRVNKEVENLSREVGNLSQEVKNVSQEVKSVSQEVKNVSREVKKTSESLGRLGNKLGDFIEEMVYPAAVRLFQKRGIDIHEVYRNITSKRDGEGIEIDLLVVNNTDAIAIECKSSLSIDDVNEHLERMEKLKRLLPLYRDKNVMGAVTAMIIPDNVARYAYKKGLFVIGQTGEQLEVRNDANFKAKIW